LRLKDDAGSGEGLISTGDSRVSALLIRAREDLVILAEVLRLV